MDINEIVSLTIPLIAIVVGVYIKRSNSDQLNSIKKLWLLFVITGVFLFLFRLLKML